MFSCEFWEISQNTFSYRTPPVTASGLYILIGFDYYQIRRGGNLLQHKIY